MASTVFRWLRRAAILAVAGFVVWQAVAAAEDVLPPGDDALQRATMKITGRQSGDAGDDHAPGAGVAAPGEPNAGSATPSELPLGPGRPAASTLSAGGAGSEITLAGDPVAQNPTGESRAPVPGEASGGMEYCQAPMAELRSTQASTRLISPMAPFSMRSLAFW